MGSEATTLITSTTNYGGAEQLAKKGKSVKKAKNQEEVIYKMVPLGGGDGFVQLVPVKPGNHIKLPAVADGSPSLTINAINSFNQDTDYTDLFDQGISSFDMPVISDYSGYRSTSVQPWMTIPRTAAHDTSNGIAQRLNGSVNRSHLDSVKMDSNGHISLGDVQIADLSKEERRALADHIMYNERHGIEATEEENSIVDVYFDENTGKSNFEKNLDEASNRAQTDLMYEREMKIHKYGGDLMTTLERGSWKIGNTLSQDCFKEDDKNPGAISAVEDMGNIIRTTTIHKNGDLVVTKEDKSKKGFMGWLKGTRGGWGTGLTGAAQIVGGAVLTAVGSIGGLVTAGTSLPLAGAGIGLIADGARRIKNAFTGGTAYTGTITKFHNDKEPPKAPETIKSNSKEGFFSKIAKKVGLL